MATKEQRRYNNILKNINGLTIMYTDESYLTWKCIVLAAPRKGLSIKSLASPKYIRKKAGKIIVDRYDLKPEDSRFCHIQSKPEGIKEDLPLWENVIKTKKLVYHDITIGHGFAYCPF